MILIDELLSTANSLFVLSMVSNIRDCFDNCMQPCIGALPSDIDSGKCAGVLCNAVYGT